MCTSRGVGDGNERQVNVCVWEGGRHHAALLPPFPTSVSIALVNYSDSHQSRRGRVYFSSQFWVTVHRYQQVTVAASHITFMVKNSVLYSVFSIPI